MERQVTSSFRSGQQSSLFQNKQRYEQPEVLRRISYNRPMTESGKPDINTNGHPNVDDT